MNQNPFPVARVHEPRKPLLLNGGLGIDDQRHLKEHRKTECGAGGFLV